MILEIYYNGATYHEKETKIIKNRGGVKINFFKISLLIFLTIHLDSAYQKTYTWVKIWLKSVAHSLKKLTLKFSPKSACYESRVSHISKTVKFRTLVLLRHLFSVIKPTIINGQNDDIIFFIFLLIRKNAIFCSGVVSDPGTYTRYFIYCGKTNAPMKILISSNESWQNLRQSPKCFLSVARVLYFYGRIGIAGVVNDPAQAD